MEIPRPLHYVCCVGYYSDFGLLIRAAHIGQSGWHTCLLSGLYILDKHCDSIAERNMSACSFGRSVSKYSRHKSGNAQNRRTIWWLKRNTFDSCRRRFDRWRRMQNNFTRRNIEVLFGLWDGCIYFVYISGCWVDTSVLLCINPIGALFRPFGFGCFNVFYISLHCFVEYNSLPLRCSSIPQCKYIEKL